MTPAMASYNVEMTEVSGGTFWKSYTPEQIAGTEEVPPPDFSQGNPVLSMMEWIDPIDSKNPKLIKLAKAIASGLWVRVSGGWATKTYYDFDGEGLYRHDEPWNPSQAEKIFALSKEHGVPIAAVEFANEPNMLYAVVDGYTAADFRRDQDLFHKWLSENYPEVIKVDPCTCDPEPMRAYIEETGQEETSAGTFEIAPGTCVFITI